jgi:VWFA-related protein
MTIRQTVGGVIAVALACMAIVPTHAQRDARQRQIGATVVDKDGALVTGLGVADFTVSEDKAAREVLGVKPMTAPAHIALLIDTSQAVGPTVQELRESLGAFVTKTLTASPDTQIALVSFGDRPTQILDYTSSAPVLQRSIGKIFSMPGSGAYVLDAIVDAGTAITKKKLARAAIVAFVVEQGQEFSNTTYQRVSEVLQDAGASLWAVVLQGTPPHADSDESRNRDVVLGDVTRLSGGGRENALARTAVAGRFDRIATLMTSQYEITYARPDMLIPPKAVDVTVNRPKVTLMAPHWAGK